MSRPIENFPRFLTNERPSDYAAIAHNAAITHTKVYLAGPMTGIPFNNFPAFDDAAARLRAEGFEVISPAELDEPEVRRAALENEAGTTDPQAWGDFLGRDVSIIANEVTGIVFLPGWEQSRGARLEAYTGLLTGKDFYVYNPDAEVAVYPLDAGAVASTLTIDLPDRSGRDIRGVAPPPEEQEGEVRHRDPNTGGAKGVKLERYDLIPFEALDELARVFGKGAQKYEPHNYLKGYPWGWSLGALLRHVSRWQQGESYDPETGLHHLAHAAWHCLALIMFERHGLGTDDRWRSPSV